MRIRNAIFPAILITLVSCGDNNIATKKDIEANKNEVVASGLCLKGPLNVSFGKLSSSSTSEAMEFSFSKAYETESKKASGHINMSYNYNEIYGASNGTISNHFYVAQLACSDRDRLPKSYEGVNLSEYYRNFKVELIYSVDSSVSSSTSKPHVEATAWNCYGPC
jgi:hypothetical protein